MSNPLSRSLKPGDGSEDSQEEVSEDKEESLESKGKRVRGEKTSEDVDRDDFKETEDSGSGSGGGVADKVNEAVDRVKDAVSGGSGGSSGSSGSSDKENRTANVSSENASDPKTQEDVVSEEFKPRSDDEEADRLEGNVRDKGLVDSERVEQEVRQRNRFQDDDFVERKTEFVRSVRAEDRARRQKKRIEDNIQRLENSSENAEIVIGEGENAESLSRSEAISRLEESKSRAENVVERSEEFQTELQSSPESQVINIESLPENVQRDLRSQRSSDGEIDRLPTDGLNTEYPGGTRIDAGRSQGDPLSRPEFRSTFEQNVQGFKDVSVLAGTSAGFQAPFAVVDPDRTVSGVIQEQEREAERQDIGGRTLEFLGSPAGVLAGGALARGAGAGVQGGKAIVNNRLPGLASSRLASTAGSVGKAGVLAGGGYLVGRQAVSGVQNIKQGQLTKGGGQIFQVASEAGAIAKGFRSGSREYSPQASRTTKVEQESVLKQVADEDTLRGVGKLKARTPVTRKQVFGEEENIGEAVSTGNFKVVADQEFGQAKGEIVEELPSGSTSEKGFTAQTDVKARSSSGDEVVQRSVVRTEEEGLLFRETSDVSGSSVVRKESESPVSNVVSVSEVDDGVVSSLEDDVVQAVRAQDVDAKVVESSGRTSFDEGGVVFSDSESLVLNRRSGSVSGDGVVSSSGGQSLEGGQAGLSQGQRAAVSNQRELGQRFGQASRQSVSDSLESSDTLVGSTQGGSGLGGNQAGLNQNLASSQETVQKQESKEEENDVEVIDIDTRIARLEEAKIIQEKRGVVGQVQVEKNSAESGQVSTTASRIAGNLNDDFKTTTDLSTTSGELTKAGRRIGSSVGQSQRNVNAETQLNQNIGAQRVSGRKSLNVPKVGVQSSLQIRALQTVQALEAGQRVQQGQTSLTSNIQVGGQPGGSGGLPFNLQLSGISSPGKGSGSVDKGSTGLTSYRDLSWFSANLVEQETGQEARFPLTGSGSALNPVKTVQESSGRVEQFEIYDSNDRGENKIW